MEKLELRTELKKKHPFSSSSEELVLSIWRTSDQLQNRFGRLFRRFGLTGSQYNVLRILRGEARPMPCTEIVDRMIQVVPAMTGLLDRLEKQSLIRRNRSIEDRRVVFVEITDAGKELLGQLDEPVSALHKRLVGKMKRDNIKGMIQMLEGLRRVLVEENETSNREEQS